jgi:hypothetical protein
LCQKEQLTLTVNDGTGTKHQPPFNYKAFEEEALKALKSGKSLEGKGLFNKLC